MIFGSNVKESGEVVRRYIIELMNQLKVLEEESFSIHIGDEVLKI